jgi:DNA-directed RNA polymerase subunit omega
LNADYCRQALEKVVNPNILVNLVSKRVRQLNSAGGAVSRPLIADVASLGAADTALLEIIEDKITYEQLPEVPAHEAHLKRKRRG